MNPTTCNEMTNQTIHITPTNDLHPTHKLDFLCDYSLRNNDVCRGGVGKRGHVLLGGVAQERQLGSSCSFFDN